MQYCCTCSMHYPSIQYRSAWTEQQAVSWRSQSSRHAAAEARSNSGRMGWEVGVSGCGHPLTPPSLLMVSRRRNIGAARQTRRTAAAADDLLSSPVSFTAAKLFFITHRRIFIVKWLVGADMPL